MSEPADTLLALTGAGLIRHLGRLVVIIDGGSGSGKSTLAGELHRFLTAAGRRIRLIGLDEFYPGWDGLAAASEMVVTDVLHPTHPGFQRWDWANDRPADWVRLDPAEDLIIEGCGALTPASSAYADLTLWLEVDPETRKRLALARDGEGFAPHWDRWAAQEQQHWSTNSPQNIAGLVFCLTPQVR